ncbi:hypothetical protein [Mycolicibacterium neoaurum]|uniref:hypothetical protein n=1 Tax=Mycolicibacterium neoaurum TaxID=1795 RepID=UPI001038E5D6|nr:hypothetical protein [Mycolicibacterium neoaurum]
MDTEVDRRLGATRIDTQLEVLRDLITSSQDEANSLIVERRDDLIELLAQDLEALVDEIGAAVERLGPGVDTAAAAIDADAADTWKQISTAVPVYEDIRLVQLELYRSADFEKIDRAACGDGIQVYDPEARLYYHRNLDDVAPDWKPGLDARGNQRDSSLPWPSDPTQRLIWCINRDSGIWCPTATEIAASLNTVPPRLQGGDRERPAATDSLINLPFINAG